MNIYVVFSEEIMNPDSRESVVNIFTVKDEAYDYCNDNEDNDSGFKYWVKKVELKQELPVSKTPHCCPVCNGKGQVVWYFYDVNAGSSTVSSNMSPINCRTCNGEGVIWSTQQ